MKRNKQLMMAALTVLLMASCRKDAQMLTVINNDGSCMRELTKSVAPGELTGSDGNAGDGKENGMDGWLQTWSVKGEDAKRHPLPMTKAQYDSLQREHKGEQVAELVVKHYTRAFRSVEEMSRCLPTGSDCPLRVEGSLKKHFRWFYTEYVFKEAFDYDTGDSLTFFPIPLDRFVGADTAAYWFTGHPDLADRRNGAELNEMLDRIEGKISRWINANMFAEVYDYIGENYEKVKNAPVSKEQFMARRDTLAMSPDIVEKEAFDNDDDEALKKFLDDYFHTNAYSSFAFNDDSLEQRFSKYNFLQLYLTYDLVMPGKVTDTGMGTYDGEVIRYRLTGERLVPGTYTITATSRVTNAWAFVVTILVIVMAIGSFVYREKLRRKR